jgi:hypothetical protein
VDDLSVEFLPEEHPPNAPAPQRRLPVDPGRWLAGFAALVGAAVLLTVARGGNHLRDGQPQACAGSSCVPEPSPAIVAVFQAHLPGAVVMDEQTRLTRMSLRSHQALDTRLVHVLYGNVVITVLVEPESVRAPASAAIRFDRGGYQLDFSFDGYYPPTVAQLVSLVNDVRLISL